MPVLSDFDDSTELIYENLIDTEGVDEEEIIQALKSSVSTQIRQLYNNRAQITFDNADSQR